MTRTSSLHAWIDASAGVAGDMLLAALVDAGADIIAVQAAVDQVIPDAVRLSATTVNRAGMRATKVDVTVLVDDPPHRTWRNIQTMLSASDLPDRIRDDALAVFTQLANAEGHVHGIDAQDVHFHEVGALDSLADVIGVCAALHQLGIRAISVSPIAVGSGRIKAAHGHIPVPVPAVTQLAKGWQIHSGGEGELTTPTGMALVTTIASGSAELPPMILHSTGSGAGTKDTPGRPNITRVIIGEPTSRHHDPVSTAVVLETNVNDLDPRLWPGVLNRLLSDGASDAWLTPILMKKGRPAHTLKVLCQPDLADGLRQVIYAETTTLGIRQHTVSRHAALRGFAQIDINGDTVAIKLAHRDGQIVQAAPEFEDIARAARRQQIPERQVLDQTKAAAARAGLVEGRSVPPSLLPATDPSTGVVVTPATSPHPHPHH
jgi:uncharacterized protein (TIGR00299 family) protein